MLYHLLSVNVFRYISLRSFLALTIATVLAVLWGKYFIAFMQKKQFGQVIRVDGPQDHFKKAGTPTMGGAFIIGSVFITILITGNFYSLPLIGTLLVMISYFILGALDDYTKVKKNDSYKGVSPRGKLFWQFVTAFIVIGGLMATKAIDGKLFLPFLKNPVVDLGYFYVLFASFVVVGSSNAVNLTDGLDGLVTGPVISSAAALSVLAYLSGHVDLANYLFIPHIPFSGELVVLAMAVIGACVGFLWYNAYPAQIFMGDVGSLSLGGILGMIAVCTKNEVLFVIIGGVFVLEAVSVILQVWSFKKRGKRIFKMAPIHHHFELSGIPETKLIIRFWIVSGILAILALSTIKLR